MNCLSPTGSPDRQAALVTPSSQLQDALKRIQSLENQYDTLLNKVSFTCEIYRTGVHIYVS